MRLAYENGRRFTDIDELKYAIQAAGDFVRVCRNNADDMGKKYSLLDIGVHYKDTCGQCICVI